MKSRWLAISLGLFLQACSNNMAPIPEAVLRGSQHKTMSSIIASNKTFEGDRFERVRAEGPYHDHGPISYFYITIPSGRYQLFEGPDNHIQGSGFSVDAKTGKQFFFRRVFDDQNEANSYAQQFYDEVNNAWKAESGCRKAMSISTTAYDSNSDCLALQMMSSLNDK